MQQALPLNRHQIIHLTVARSDADPRTVTKIIDGQHVKGRVAVRVRRVLAELGVPLPPEARPNGK